MATRSKGWIHDEAAVEEVLSSVLQPFFSEAGVALSGSGKGKRSLLFKNFEKLGIEFPKPIQSSVGDCTLAGTSVKMADGTSKNIEDIKVGEYVLDGKNQKRKVTDFIKKKYSGKIIKIHINGLPDPLCLTPDHKVDTYQDIKSELELPIESSNLKIGNNILVPFGSNIDNSEITNNSFRSKYGHIKNIDNIQEFDVQDIYVYCLEVEVDHRFQANNIKIHNCVSHATSIALDTLSVTEIVNGERERWVARSANEYFYHTSRMIIGKGRLGGGDGSINAWAAKGLLEYGSLRRQRYDQVDLTKYSPSLSRKWGSSRDVPAGLYDIAKQSKIGRFAAIKNFSEACDALYNGYPIIVASNQGFSSKRDSEGFCKPSGSWAHSMGVLGYKDDDRRPAVLIANSWPSFLPGPNEFGLPPSCFWCDAEVFDRMCKFNDTFSFASFEGFKLKPNARII